MSGREYFEKVKKERSLFERIISYIPGYRGYKEKELRRESDRLVRMAAVSRLRSAKDALRRSLTNPLVIAQMSSEDAWRVQTLLSKLDRVTQRIDRAVAGYAGLFDAVKVKEDKLDMVLEHDYGLISRAEEVRSKAEEAASMKPGSDEWRARIDELARLADELDGLVDKRTEILRGLATA